MGRTDRGRPHHGAGGTHGREESWVYRPGQFDQISTPTLLISGPDSTAEIRPATDAAPAAIPGARIHLLQGHAHIAHRTHPALVAATVRDLIAD